MAGAADRLYIILSTTFSLLSVDSAQVLCRDTSFEHGFSINPTKSSRWFRFAAFFDTRIDAGTPRDL